MKRIKVAKILFVIAMIVAVGLSGLFGYLLGNHNLVLNEKRIPNIVNRDLGQPKDINFSLFWEAYDKLLSSYQGKVNPQQYLYGAIAGAYASLEDPYTVFLTPELSADFKKELSGELEGIGVKIGVLDDYPTVIAALEGSPAAKAGLKPKDKIIKVDDMETINMPLDLVVSKIRGKAGTDVKLSVLREGEQQERSYTIKRSKIDIKTVEVKYQDDVAIITLNEFGTQTTADFTKAAKEIAEKGISKVVLDMRNNPGGLLDAAVEVAGEIFPTGTNIVYQESKTGKEEMKTTNGGTLKQAKIAVIVNEGSASAAEILAGAVKDLKRGVVIGQKTFGKGTVQQLENLSDGSSVKITVARWLTPSGQNIDKNGITPDIEVKEPDNPLFDQNDPLLNKAIEQLKQ